jgi:hypothetical protein
LEAVEMKVIVVTNSELGWDNVIGVFAIELLEQVEARFTGRYYNIQVDSVETNLDNWE